MGGSVPLVGRAVNLLGELLARIMAARDQSVRARLQVLLSCAVLKVKIKL